MYFQVHQPHRLKRYGMFEIGVHSDYFDEELNAQIMRKVAGKCYLPTNSLIRDLIEEHGGDFRVSYSITGTAIDQMEKYAPDVLESFKRLVDTGHVELLAETYHHSLSYLYSKEEFEHQVGLHTKKMQEHFGHTPEVFRNTELVFNNELAGHIEGLGYKGILAEGADHLLGWRSPNFLYRPTSTKSIKVLLKNYKLSDDIAFRFSNKDWKEHPLTVDKYCDWINKVNGNGEVINLFMDYETFGEHQWEDTGIFEFLRHFPRKHLEHPHNDFVTVSEAIERFETRGEYDAHNFVSWLTSSATSQRGWETASNTAP
jgi:alpha-amylase